MHQATCQLLNCRRFRVKGTSLNYLYPAKGFPSASSTRIFLCKFCIRSDMKAVLLRTTSGPIQASASLGSPRLAFSDQDSGAVVSFLGRNCSPYPKSGLHVRVNERNNVPRSFRLNLSEANLDPSDKITSCRGLIRRFSRSFPDRVADDQDIPEERCDLKAEAEAEDDDGSVVLKRRDLEFGISDRLGIWSVNEVLPEEFELTGGSTGKGRIVGGGRGGGRGGDGIGDVTGGSADQNSLGVYYQEMLKANPGNPLLLRNYGKYLHEVERDMLRAEEYYGRAILASPEDGEVLALYGKLIWETKRDEGRAEAYFNQAIKASPDDCYVLGSYAHFLWDAEEGEEEKEEAEVELNKSSSMATAF